MGTSRRQTVARVLGVTLFGFILSGVSLAQFASQDQAMRASQTDAFYAIKNYTFANGETIGEVRLHYVTLGTPQRDRLGHITNAVLLHGTTGHATELLAPTFADPLFGAGAALDIGKYYIVLPDNIGHGKSTKPSDGLRNRFPHFAYADMIDLQHRLVTQELHIDYLRLVGGISMGGMHTWMWGERWPTLMDALLPIACEPAPVSGRNLLWRRIYIRMMQSDPQCENGNYHAPPQSYKYSLAMFHMMDESSAHLAALTAGARQADAYIDGTLGENHAAVDPTDSIYAFDASRDYDPTGQLDKIEARLTAINFADDQLNVADLKILDKNIGAVKHGVAVVLPASADTRGHMTL